MNNIQNAFESHNAFIPYFTCGDPDLDTTAAAVRAAAANGADLIELGIPFSDPTAEGPEIQGANIRALSGGVTTDRIFAFVRELRRDVTIPLVFMSYANVVFSYGAERFIARCGEVGIDGLMVPDLPFEEREEFLPLCRRHGVCLVTAVAPTSGDRVAMIAREAEGFLYIDSSLGEEDLTDMLRTIRDHTALPCAVGFGVAATDGAKRAAGRTGCAVVDSAPVSLFAQYGKNAPGYVGAYVKEMKLALR